MAALPFLPLLLVIDMVCPFQFCQAVSIAGRFLTCRRIGKATAFIAILADIVRLVHLIEAVFLSILRKHTLSGKDRVSVVGAYDGSYSILHVQDGLNGEPVQIPTVLLRHQRSQYTKLIRREAIGKLKVSLSWFLLRL